MKTDKLQKLKALLLEAHDIAASLSDEEGDVLADTEVVTEYATFNEEDLLGYLVYNKDVIKTFFNSVEEHPGFPDHDYGK